MAQNSGYKVIAEGVTTSEQLAFLRQQRCDQIWGYIISRALNAEQMDAGLREQGVNTLLPP